MTKPPPNDEQAGHVSPYESPAAGWGAVKQVPLQLLQERVPPRNYRMLLRQNQSDGFDCPGCAWPDRHHASTFEFCENGVKAVAAEGTGKRATPELFARHTVAELLAQSDHALEQHGRLTHPLAYDPATDTYRETTWDEAFALVARHLRALPDPNQATFYTSGRASNEAAFLFQLFVRAYGTNNFPDCSNLCHEATSRGLPQTIGVGKATVTLDDFEHTDTILLFGHNAATNHPRMLGELRACARRGVTIVSINPLRERGLERFTDPQSPVEMLTGGSTRIASVFIQPTLGGDFALIKGVAKRLVEMDDDAQREGRARLIDTAFVAEHTQGLDAFVVDLRREPWADIVAASGVAQPQIDALAQLYARGQRVIACWGMGLTQHRHGVATVQMLSNLMLLRGNIGRPGAGLLPIRGHSNVQGDRTVGIEERPSEAFLDRLQQVFGFEPPRAHGLDVVHTIAAMQQGRIRVFVGLGGNFAAAAPDTPLTCEGLQRCDLTVHVATKLNRTHLVHGKASLILPTLGRTEVDLQGGVAQGVTVEDSVCMVHLSYGMNEPASPHLRSETAIVAGMAEATLGPHPIDWAAHARDYARIRDAIEQVLPGFERFNERVRVPGGFHLTPAACHRVWHTPSGKAQFVALPIEHDTPIQRARARHGERLMVMMTMRSHDQYNTTVYGHDDRYRGVFGLRRVVFINAADLARLGFVAGQHVDVTSVWDDGVERRVEDFRLVEYDIPPGCVGAYFPEANPLVPLASFGVRSGTPTYKSIPVLLSPATA